MENDVGRAVATLAAERPDLASESAPTSRGVSQKVEELQAKDYARCGELIDRYRHLRSVSWMPL